ncbi:MAG: SRPBCC domain-containing protein [Acidimicrobiales bacterium]
MPVTSVNKDPETLTMTIVAEFDASAARVWQLWEDPRQLERWWGPPTYPATVTLHEFAPGGRVSYFMTGPAGDVARGWWRFVTVDPPHRLEFENGLADETGSPHPDMPSMVVSVTISEEVVGHTRMAVASVFPSTEAMERFLDMGMQEGMTSAIGQIEGLLSIR